MDSKHTGGCLCGAVKFEVSGDFAHFFLCHCTHCRKDTGSAHSANLFSTDAHLNWLQGEDKVRTFRLPDTRHQKSFCTDCGSALPGHHMPGHHMPDHHMNGALLVVPAGSLDSPVAKRPDAHLFDKSRADWDDHLEDIARHDGLPG
jgi:hypothetical protein